MEMHPPGGMRLQGAIFGASRSDQRKIRMRSKGKLKRSDQIASHLSLASRNLHRRFGDPFPPRLRVNHRTVAVGMLSAR